MRLWSIHPRYLDRVGLVALWREALLARTVLRGMTKGYRHHPQLERFKYHPHPRRAIAFYLEVVRREAARRGYRFVASTSAPTGRVARIGVPAGQAAWEAASLLERTARRDPAWRERLLRVRSFALHPLFRRVSGGIASWERLKSPAGLPPVPGQKMVGPANGNPPDRPARKRHGRGNLRDA